MSDNVYALVYKFYRENDNARFILSQDLVEKYLRRLAWQGHGDQYMREVWGLIELLITYTDEQQLDSFGALSIFDYQELLYRYGEVHEDFSLAEKSVQQWLERLKEFYAFLYESGYDTDAVRPTKDIDANWVSENPPSMDKIRESLQRVLNDKGIVTEILFSATSA